MPKPAKSKFISPATISRADFPKYDLAIVFAGYLVLDLIFYRNILTPSVMVFGTDWLAGGYPVKQFIEESLRQYGQVPQWIPHLYGGIPLFANAGDTYFPFTILLRFLVPLHQTMACLYVLNTLIGGYFTYLFLKKLNLAFWPSFLGGLSYMFTGILVSYVYGGHEGRMVIVAFLPVVMWLIHMALDKQTLTSFLAAGLGLGFPLLIPHVQMNYYLLIMVFFYFVFRLFGILKSTKSWGKVVKLSGYFVVFLALGFLISAVLYLPFYKYVPFSPRGGEEGRGYEFATSWSMNPEETMNMAVPAFSGTSAGENSYWGRNPFKLHSEYLGVTVIFLFCLGVFMGRKEKLVLFFLAIALLSFTVAWGGHTPLYKLYYNLVPGFKKFRAPSLIYFLISFSFVVISAFGLQYVMDGLKQGQAKRVVKCIVILIGVVIALAFLISLGSSGLKSSLASLIENQPQKLAALETNFPKFIAGLWKFVLFALVIGGVLLALVKGKLKPLVAGMALCAVTVIDLWMVESKFVQAVDPPQVYFQADEVAGRLRQDESLFRIFPLQYRNDNYLMIFDLHSVAGEHGNQLQRYNEFLGTGKTAMVDFHNVYTNFNFLNLANAKYVITRQPTNFPTFKEIQKQNYYIYENLNVAPRTFMTEKYEVIMESDKILQRIAEPAFNPLESVILEEQSNFSATADSIHWKASIQEYQPMKIIVQTESDQAGFLVLLDNYYPDWRAFVDGIETRIYRADYTFRAVPVPPGKHEVEFRFDPRYYKIGKKISVLSFVGVIFLISSDWLLKRRRKKMETIPA